jgi:hypothetical protein
MILFRFVEGDRTGIATASRWVHDLAQHRAGGGVITSTWAVSAWERQQHQVGSFAQSR